MQRAKEKMIHFCHGSKIGEGFVVVTGKKNKPERIIPGWWRVRKCDECHEVFSTPADLLIPGILPDERRKKHALWWKEEKRPEEIKRRGRSFAPTLS